MPLTPRPWCLTDLAQHALVVVGTQIDQLRDLLEKSKTEAAQSAREAAEATAINASTSEAAQLVGQKLADAQAEVAELEQKVRRLETSEAALRAENERLMGRLTQQLQAEARVMDSELERHEARIALQQATAVD